ncbi:MAG: NAD-dependent epimerase/dehydratase family protein [Bacteroidetes bacterium]|nr:NAD-dependent epimerase/dehydratase family protein [Bacteroidota bacterium]
MKYFLTGATGFLGGALARLLRERGHDVVALVRSPQKAAALTAMGVTVVTGDITEKESMRGPMRGCDGVFHVAAWYKVGARDRSMAWNINVEGTRNVLELMKELQIPKGVYTSTIGINSDTHGTAPDESYRFTGTFITEYERTKAAAHDIALGFMDAGLPLVVVMPGLIYGPEGTSMTDDAIRLFLRGLLPAVPQNVAFSWAHVDDTAEAHILAMEKGTLGEKYIIAGEQCTLTEAFTLAAAITGKRRPLFLPPALLRFSSALAAVIEKVLPLPAMYSAESLRVQAGVTYMGDNGKARRELGFNPRPLAEGLAQTLRYEMETMRGR